MLDAQRRLKSNWADAQTDQPSIPKGVLKESCRDRGNNCGNLVLGFWFGFRCVKFSVSVRDYEPETKNQQVCIIVSK